MDFNNCPRSDITTPVWNHVTMTFFENRYRLCGLVFRVPGYSFTGTGFDSWCYQIFWELVGLEWGTLSLVRIMMCYVHENERLLCRKPRITAVGIRCLDQATPHYPQILILNSPTSGIRYISLADQKPGSSYDFFVSMVKSKWMRLEGRVACVGKYINACRIVEVD
jgi:hypothetical protein